jgi:outer membrane protein OmpU
MNNFRKIGLTALAGSLVASSVSFAGDLAVTGSAEMAMANHSQKSTGKTISMVNSVNFAGSGETDGGLTVNLSFELDQGAGDGTGPFDNHKVSVGSDSLGTLTVHGHGGSNAAAAVDATASGDLWDNTLGITTAASNGGLTPKAGPSGAGLVVYTLPSIADGVALNVSYDSAGENDEGSTAIGLVYTGIEGLTVSLGSGNDQSSSQVEADYTTMKASYVYGSITAAISASEYDHTTASKDQEVQSWGLTYTVTDDISLSYGQDTIENNLDTADVEVAGLTASYTSGGMTVTAKNIKGDNVDGSSTGVNNNNEMFKLSASFAF